MSLSSSDLEAWKNYFKLLQEIADEVGLEDEEDSIITTEDGGTEGV